jgi:hypothetical protein
VNVNAKDFEYKKSIDGVVNPEIINLLRKRGGKTGGVKTKKCRYYAIHLYSSIFD